LFSLLDIDRKRMRSTNGAADLRGYPAESLDRSGTTCDLRLLILSRQWILTKSRNCFDFLRPNANFIDVRQTLTRSTVHCTARTWSRSNTSTIGRPPVRCDQFP